MDKREFIMQFVLNRATSAVSTDGPFWVAQAEKAWDKLNAIAPATQTYAINSSAVPARPW